MTSVLLVDDQEELLVALGRYFRLRGFEADTATSVAGAKAKLARSSYDVVITDLRLTLEFAGAEGLEVVRAARAANPDAVVILLSAYATAAIEAEAAEAGATRTLAKPQAPSDIERAVRGLMADRHATRT